MKLRIHEILEAVVAASSKKNKLEILKEHNSLALRNVLKGAFDDDITFILPEGKSPVILNEDPNAKPDAELQDVSDKLAIMVKNKRNMNIAPLKRETAYIQLLKSIHFKDAEVLDNMKDKKLHVLYKGLNKKLVQEAFPALIVK